jgi:hypothetical protein
MIRKITISLFLVIAGLFIFAQSAWLLTVPEPMPEISEWLAQYKITSSIKSYGMAILLIFSSISIWRFPSKTSYAVGFALSIIASWYYIGNDLWIHYVEMPKRFVGLDRPMPPYFQFERLLHAMPRFLWHILIPISVTLSFLLLINKKASNKSHHATTGSGCACDDLT